MEYAIIRSDELVHWGIKGQKWGIRRYENEDGTLTEAGKKRYARAEKIASREKISKEQMKSNAKRRAAVGAVIGSSAAQLASRASIKNQFKDATTDKFFEVNSTDDIAGYTNKDYERAFTRTGKPMWYYNSTNNPTGRMQVVDGSGTITGITKAFKNNGAAFHFGEAMTKNLLIAPAAGAAIGAGAGALGSVAVDKLHNARIDKAKKFVEKYTNAYQKTLATDVEKIRKEQDRTHKKQIKAYKDEHPNTKLSDKEIEAML